MQIRSRELLWPQSPKHSLSKNGTEQFKFKVIQFNCYNTTYNIENYKIDKRFFFNTSTQSPITSNSSNRTFPLQYVNIAKHRNDKPKGLKIMQLV